MDSMVKAISKLNEYLKILGLAQVLYDLQGQRILRILCFGTIIVEIDYLRIRSHKSMYCF